MKMRRLRLVFTLVSIAALVWVASPVQLLVVLRAADLRWLAAGIVISVAATLLAARVFQLILAVRGVSARFAAVLAANLAGDLYALSLPGGLAVGGAVRLLRLGRDGQGMSGVLAATIRQPAAGDPAAIVAGHGGHALGRGPPAVAWQLDDCLGPGRGSGRVRLCREEGIRPTHPPLRLGPDHAAAAAPQRGDATVAPAFASGRSYCVVSAAAHAKILALGVLRHLVGAAASCFRAGGRCRARARPGTLGQGNHGIAMLLPLSVAGLGLREMSYVALLGLFGVDPATAIAMSLMVFGCLLLNAAVGALAELRSAVRALDARASPHQP